MKSMSIYILLVAVLFCYADKFVIAQDTTKTTEQQQPIQHQQHFIDKNGDGYNDNAPDHDGDGIPNGLDPDWQKLKREQKRKQKHRFIDLDGDGINDNLLKVEKSDQMKGQQQNREQGSSLGKRSQNNQNRPKKKRAGNN